ncbi:SRPBCC family protein [Crossiella sp. CA198]|uniref:SRPBCC family protein n=1 Tax=Crossiella sp. CA198 TaxID=3455607 RepID=UPI003F8D6B44
MDRIERQIQIAAPVERVWAVLTEPTHIAQWFGQTAEVDLRPGGAASFGWTEHGTSHAVVERVEPPSFFSYRWNLVDHGPAEQGKTTLVEFTLAEKGEGTELTVVETGFSALEVPAERQLQHSQDNTGGWKAELDELIEYVQRAA